MKFPFPKVFASDLKKYGRETAIFNQGFLKGDDNGFKRATKDLKRVARKTKLTKSAKLK
jgi:hypothetical protein